MLLMFCWLINSLCRHARAMLGAQSAQALWDFLSTIHCRSCKHCRFFSQPRAAALSHNSQRLHLYSPRGPGANPGIDLELSEQEKSTGSISQGILTPFLL